MRTDAIAEKFDRLGVYAEITTTPQSETNNLNVNVINEKYYKIDVIGNTTVEIPNVRKDLRHLLLLGLSPLERDKTTNNISRYLCGHDERHWFVAAVPGTVSTVMDAMDSLRPDQAQAALKAQGVRNSKKNKRHNEAYKRQGEWFFIPIPNKIVDENMLHLNEPIQRGRGKPHICEVLYREGGTTVYVNSLHPNGLTEEEYAQEKNLKLGNMFPWRTMKRDATVYVKGKISHPDHATIILDDWCMVISNTENEAKFFQSMAFLD